MILADYSRHVPCTKSVIFSWKVASKLYVQRPLENLRGFHIVILVKNLMMGFCCFPQKNFLQAPQRQGWGRSIKVLIQLFSAVIFTVSGSDPGSDGVISKNWIMNNKYFNFQLFPLNRDISDTERYRKLEEQVGDDDVVTGFVSAVHGVINFLVTLLSWSRETQNNERLIAAVGEKFWSE